MKCVDEWTVDDLEIGVIVQNNRRGCIPSLTLVVRNCDCMQVSNSGEGSLVVAYSEVYDPTL